MHDPPTDLSPSGGEATRDALEEVLRDQADRRERQSRGGRPTHRSSGPLWVAAVVLAGVSVSVWTRPPAWIRPDPFPTPPATRIEAGLRMDMWVAVQQIRSFQTERRRLPVTLWEAIPEPVDSGGLSYQRLSSGAFRLVGQRAGVEVVYDSTTPIDQLNGPALASIRGGAGQ